MNKEQEYIKYINAVREKDKFLRQGFLAFLENSGFNPDLYELKQLIAINPKVKSTLFNKSITIVLKVDSIAGHVSIKELPVYDKDEKTFVNKHQGFRPKSIKGVLYGPGGLVDEQEHLEKVEPTIKDEINLPLSKIIMISQEQWEKLGYWAEKFQDENNQDLIYFVGANLITSTRVYNCAKFVEAALLHIGYVNGLGGVFSQEEIALISDNKYALLSVLLPPTFKELFNSCNLEDNSNSPNGCYNLSKLQIEQIEQRLILGEKLFIRNAIQMLFDKAQELADKDIEDLPPPSPRMVNAAVDGFKLAYELQSNFSSMFGVPVPKAPNDPDLYTKASDLMAYSHNMIDCAFAMGRMYNEIHGIQAQNNQSSSNSSSSSPKPNL